MAQVISVRVYNLDAIDNRLFNSAIQGVPVSGARFVYTSQANVPAIQAKILLPPNQWSGPQGELLTNSTVTQLIDAANA